MASVTVTRETLVLPTYLPHAPDKNPMFLEKRVYQGSSGKVYPLPFIDRIAQEKTDERWEAVHIENEFVRVTLLPQLGGRIHAGLDKTNGYDFFYRQNVIKPALVGLAGPWISGGVEFNWPQHHRPSTFMPADVAVEEHPDGSRTVWMSEHEPLNRMKGMHGVRLYPDKNYIELRARVYNGTPAPQTFLWWANAGVRAHALYQSVFPPDVQCVADHAKRAMSGFPLCRGHYYGVDYGARAGRKTARGHAANDLSWYGNIPVPTSYMCMGTGEDFFGGYDHAREAGVIHIANHHISPGKKQWVWGNAGFGRAWDRHLTDPDENGECAPYVELMAGVYTDNQPDFAWLMPGETKTWSQYWYPVQKIGPAQKANLDAAASLRVDAERGVARIGVSVSSLQTGARVRLLAKDRLVREFARDLAPDKPFVEEVKLPRARHRLRETDLRLVVRAAGGRELIAYSPKPPPPKKPVPPPATEPPPPAGIAGNDELYVTGLHLEQYRHATRRPEPYWREALRRDPGDSRCHNALGRWHLRRGELAEAEAHFRAAIERLTRRNPNPRDGEPWYHLGLTLRMRAAAAASPPLLDEAYAFFYKATWNHAWQASGFHALAELDCLRGDWTAALDHLDRALRVNTDNLKARDLRAIVLRKLGRDDEAAAQLRDTLALDPLDWWARFLNGEPLSRDTQTRLDLALDFARAGLFADALAVLDGIDVARAASPCPPRGRDVRATENHGLAARATMDGTAPLAAYYRAWLCAKLGRAAETRRHLAAAAKAPPDYCFPARPEEIAILEFAMRENPRDARAPYYLGNLLYDRRRFADAIALWEKSARLDATFPTVWRNLGIGWFNISGKPAKARAAYERAFKAGPRDARLLFERDQLWKRMGASPARRLRELERHPALTRRRDDLSVELCALYNQTGAPEKALRILESRPFQPWEGGEGQALAHYARAGLLLARAALDRGDARGARRRLERVLAPPENLGETWHPLANGSEIWYWLGEACAMAGDAAAARKHWRQAAEFRGDFQEMSVRAFSEMTYFSALALRRLGREKEAADLLRGLLAHARALAGRQAKIDYFATSLPTMLLFEDDLQARQKTKAARMEALALHGLGRTAAAKRLCANMAGRDANFPWSTTP
ncbi:MAG: DUF5107 domain-containing protein [Opitutaceae bacterium]|nr:DUF5107 domain-containing protein [Opitutaceae bacterium]